MGGEITVKHERLPICSFDFTQSVRQTIISARDASASEKNPYLFVIPVSCTHKSIDCCFLSETTLYDFPKKGGLLPKKKIKKKCKRLISYNFFNVFFHFTSKSFDQAHVCQSMRRALSGCGEKLVLR